MDILEAINHFKYGITHDIFKEPVTSYAKMAIEALEKQVPKKPFDKSNNPEDWHVMCCPTCKRIFWNSGDWMHYEPIVCEKCGQYIDWSKQYPYRD